MAAFICLAVGFKPELADRYNIDISKIPNAYAYDERYCVEMLLVLDYALYRE